MTTLRSRVYVTNFFRGTPLDVKSLTSGFLPEYTKSNLLAVELKTLLGIFYSMSVLVLTLDFGAFPTKDRSVVASAKSIFISYCPGAGPSFGLTQKLVRSVVDPKAPNLTP